MPHLQLYLPLVFEATAVLYNSSDLSPVYLNYTALERNQTIERYWGDMSEMQIFPIGFRTIEHMFDKSFDKQTIALHVTHITDKTKVDAEWLPVQVKQVGSNEFYDFALNISEEQDYYFILKRTYYNADILPGLPPTQVTGGMKAATKDNANVIFATIGKNEDNSYSVFTNAGQLRFINGGDGTGGNGYTAGAKVPPGM
jgi:hypothetical protein